MIRAEEFRKKLKIDLENQPWMMVDVDHVRPGKGQGFTRTKLKNMITGQVVEKTFKSGDVVKPAQIEDCDMQFLYQSGDEYTFMNNSNYEQINLTADILGDLTHFLYEGIDATVSLFNGLPISCEITNFVELEITECDPGVKGNTAANALKPATLSTGHRVNVPLFVEQGEWVRVDTRTGDYVERCKRPQGR